MTTVKRSLTFVLLVLASATGFALTKKEKFNAPAEEVFTAALKAARKDYNVTFVDDKHMMITFHTNQSGLSFPLDCNATVQAEGESAAEVEVDVHMTGGQKVSWGSDKRTAEKFLKTLSEELDHSQKAKTSSPAK